MLDIVLPLQIPIMPGPPPLEPPPPVDPYAAYAKAVAMYGIYGAHIQDGGVRSFSGTSLLSSSIANNSFFGGSEVESIATISGAVHAHDGGIRSFPLMHCGSCLSIDRSEPQKKLIQTLVSQT